MDKDHFHKARLTFQSQSAPQSFAQLHHHRASSNLRKVSYSQVSQCLYDKQRSKSIEASMISKNKQAIVSSAKQQDQNLMTKNDQFVTNLMALPSIKEKIKTEEPKASIPFLKSYSSVKINVGPYRKIEAILSDRYIAKINSLKGVQTIPERKLFTISEISSSKIQDVLKMKKEKKIVEVAKLKVKNLKNNCIIHLNRVKDQVVATQLHTIRIKGSDYDGRNAELKQRNVMRYQYNGNQSGRSKLGQPDQKWLDRLQGWGAIERDYHPSFCFLQK